MSAKITPTVFAFSKRSLVVGSFLGLIFTFGCYWVGMVSVQRDYPAIAQAVPVIRLSGGLGIAPLMFLMLPFGLWGSITSFLRLINKPHWEKTFQDTIGKKVVYTVTPLALVLLLLQPFATRIIMPKYGYSICYKLEGGLSMYHNDWVRNPDWCVQGKTHQWVKAMAAREAGADVDPEEAQRRAIAREHLPKTRPDGWLWFLGAGIAGAFIWTIELRYWDDVRRKSKLARWFLLTAGGLIAGLTVGMSALLANDMSEGRIWVTLLVVALTVAWPLLGFLDKRPPLADTRPSSSTATKP